MMMMMVKLQWSFWCHKIHVIVTTVKLVYLSAQEKQPTLLHSTCISSTALLTEHHFVLLFFFLLFLFLFLPFLLFFISPLCLFYLSVIINRIRKVVYNVNSAAWITMKESNTKTQSWPTVHHGLQRRKVQCSSYRSQKLPKTIVEENSLEHIPLPNPKKINLNSWIQDAHQWENVKNTVSQFWKNGKIIRVSGSKMWRRITFQIDSKVDCIGVHPFCDAFELESVKPN